MDGITIKLRQLFDYSRLPIAITAAFLGMLTVAILIMFLYGILKDVKRKEKVVEELVEEPVFVKPDLPKLKSEYIGKLAALEAEYNKDTTKIRPAYEGMSKIVREFVYKATGMKVDKLTLAEICRTEYKDLAKLVGEYYRPEFDQISEGDVKSSLAKSRRLVSEWN